jgi:3-oxoacyl-[acyl-carrier-protein] synthase II
VRRAVITGAGLVTCLGTGTEATWQAVRSGTSGITTIEAFDTRDLRTHIGGEVRGFVARDFVEHKDVRHMDRFIQYAVASARLALDQSGLRIGGAFAERVGVSVSSGIGGIGTIHHFARSLEGPGHGRLSPYFLPMVLINLAAGQIAIRCGARGPIVSPVSACASGSHSIGVALDWIRAGRADAVIAGGSEAALCRLGLASFEAMRALSNRNDDPPRASRPFDRGRDGFVMSDGAGVVVLEERAHALDRGAPILGEVLGYGMSGDAHHVTAPPPGGEGAVRCMRLALEDARLAPGDVEYVNAHGTGTPMNDVEETRAIRTVFGSHADALPVSSTKSMLGHSLGATGAIEAVLTALALRDRVLPPTINLDDPDPACDLDYVPNAARAVGVDFALSNSLGFGGTNVTLAIASPARARAERSNG